MARFERSAVGFGSEQERLVAEKHRAMRSRRYMGERVTVFAFTQYPWRSWVYATLEAGDKLKCNCEAIYFRAKFFAHVVANFIGEADAVGTGASTAAVADIRLSNGHAIKVIETTGNTHVVGDS